MKALVWKELRELRWAAVALVGCAVVIAGVEVLYGRLSGGGDLDGPALLVWMVMSAIVAFLGGAAAIARESRSRMVFLSAWPQSRARVWLAKAISSFVMTFAVIAIMFGIWLLLSHSGTLGRQTVGADSGVFIANAWYLFGLCFVFGLLWSGLVNSVLGAAALGLLSMGLITAGGLWFFSEYLPHNWGPYITQNQLSSGWAGLLAQTARVIVLLVLAGGVFARTSLLDGRRRILLTLSLLIGLVLLSTGWHTAQMVLGNRPVLERGVAETGLVDGGRFRYYLMPAQGKNPGGLWVEPVSGGEIKLVARGKVYRYDANRKGLEFSHMAMDPGGGRYTNWTVQFPSLRLKRLPDSPIVRSARRTAMKL